MSVRPPKPALKAHVVHWLVRHPNPVHRLRAGTKALELYYEPGDPHSHLAAQLLPMLSERLRIPVVVRVVDAPESALYPEADKQRQFAIDDARMVAPAYGLSFPAQAAAPDAGARRPAAAVLLEAAAAGDFAAREAEVAETLFQGGRIAASAGSLDEAAVTRQLEANGRRRARLGHYLPGMWQFNGIWYWGVDRMAHLEAALRAAGLLQGDAPLLQCQPEAARLPDGLSAEAPLEFFYSFRSPYSYLAAVDVQQAQADWPGPIQVRPVLPMVMRGLKVPTRKRMYIVRDTYREAQRRDLPFGLVADPVGAGAERCLTSFTLAGDTTQQLALLVAAARAIWSQGVDVATDAGLRSVIEAAGMDWAAVRAKLDDGIDLAQAEANRQALFAAGLWGVPSFRYGPLVTWGQDRWWLVAEARRRLTAGG